MTDPTTVPSRFIGCDVSKAKIDIFDDQTGDHRVVDNRPDALAAFMEALTPDCLLVCETTGGYEAGLLQAATVSGIPIHRADARKVKAFIQSFGTLAKTDRIDATRLARYARERHHSLARWQPRPRALKQLAALVRLRDKLVKQRAALICQDKAPEAELLRPHLAILIDQMSDRLKAIEGDITNIVEQSQPLAKTVKIIQKIPGCGPATAHTLAALMPELGTINRRQAAALAGLAPHPKQSGARDAYRPTRGGRPHLKRVLFMAAMAARRHNPELKSVYQRLVQNGKKPIVALTAIMRKLITIINARIRDANIIQTENSV